jgi:glycosyltransferase involved in cell wall biosynthesis
VRTDTDLSSDPSLRDRDAAGRPARRPGSKPRLAIFSPWPPKRSGISDYAARLAAELSRSYWVDVYHDAGYIPELGLRPGAEFACYDYRLFRRRAAVLGYRGVVYQMGNSFYHGFLFEMLGRFPGVVTLHDFNLAAFHFWRAHQGGVPMDNFRRELAYCYPDRIEEFDPQLWDWAGERRSLHGACVRRGLYLNRRVFEAAEAVVVHSPWCLEQARRADPSHAAKTVVIPMGASPRVLTEAQRAEVRGRFGLPASGLIFGCFGILSHDKLHAEAIEAFGALAADLPSSRLVFVGQDGEDGDLQARAAALGLGDRIRFLGRQPDADFADLIAVADVGVCLRRPPTYGETSAALLDLLRHGVPTVVTDVDTFADYPDEVVRKVRWPDDGLDGLARALRALAEDQARREALGRAALEHVARHHSWSRAAALYVDVIERHHSTRGIGPDIDAAESRFPISNFKSQIID